MCSESAFLKAYVRHLLLERDDALVLDMEAGLEHLGRGTAAGVQALVVVVEPGMRAVQTARRVFELGADLGIGRVVAVGNRVRDEADVAWLREHLDPVPLLGTLPDSADVRAADRDGAAPFDRDPAFPDAVARIADALEALVTDRTDS
jgi:CO dehydrogenase maturation factor